MEHKLEEQEYYLVPYNNSMVKALKISSFKKEKVYLIVRHLTPNTNQEVQSVIQEERCEKVKEVKI